ncbi:MAG TPA: DUF521 domain-containing protein [Desulfurococcales archaeon]|nr:DUF521 domain-containing protein [Desulfurococcales archaeon]
MYLNKYEELILNGEYGYIKAKALKALVKMGEALGANKLIRISHAHISGISYTTIGEVGLELLRELALEKVCVNTTCNPAGFDLTHWRRLGVPEEYYKKQIEIINLLRKMGVKTTLSCTPYLTENISKGDHISWAESNAVLYANSITGAMTNREGGLSALLAALVGRTPNYGLHLQENRKPTVIVSIEINNIEVDEPSILSAIGYSLGLKVGYGIPYIVNSKILTNLELIKYFMAGIGTTSALGMIIISHISPDERNIKQSDLKGLDRISLGMDDIIEVYECFNEVSIDKCDVIYLGCPHLSLDELLYILKFISSVKIPNNIKVWLTTSRNVVNKIVKLGYNVIELWRKGILILCDMCPIVAPLEKLKVKNIITDSAKAAYYLRKMHKAKVTLMSRHNILKLLKNIC